MVRRLLQVVRARAPARVAQLPSLAALRRAGEVRLQLRWAQASAWHRRGPRLGSIVAVVQPQVRAQAVEPMPARLLFQVTGGVAPALCFQLWPRLRPFVLSSRRLIAWLRLQPLARQAQAKTPSSPQRDLTVSWRAMQALPTERLRLPAAVARPRPAAGPTTSHRRSSRPSHRPGPSRPGGCQANPTAGRCRAASAWPRVHRCVPWRALHAGSVQ